MRVKPENIDVSFSDKCDDHFVKMEDYQEVMVVDMDMDMDIDNEAG
jgi:hypothetical protein